MAKEHPLETMEKVLAAYVPDPDSPNASVFRYAWKLCMSHVGGFCGACEGLGGDNENGPCMDCGGSGRDPAASKAQADLCMAVLEQFGLLAKLLKHRRDELECALHAAFAFEQDIVDKTPCSHPSQRNVGDGWKCNVCRQDVPKKG